MNGAPVFSRVQMHLHFLFHKAQKQFSSFAAESGLPFFFSPRTQNLRDRAWVSAGSNSRNPERTQEGRGRGQWGGGGLRGASRAPAPAPPARRRDLAALDQSAPTCAHLAAPPPAGSREPRFSKGRAELSGALARRRGSFSPLSLQPWGSLVGLSRPSSSASSSYSRYSIALP